MLFLSGIQLFSFNTNIHPFSSQIGEEVSALILEKLDERFIAWGKSGVEAKPKRVAVTGTLKPSDRAITSTSSLFVKQLLLFYNRLE